MIRVGDRIPDIEVEAFHRDEFVRIRLSDYRGKWLILAFYPADFSFVCPTELEELAENYEEFARLDAEVLSVSTDTVYVHKAWHDHSPAVGKVRFPMIADPTGRLCRIFGTYIEEEGVSLRATFIVDPDGILRAFEMHDNSIGRSTGEILRKLKASRHVREHRGEVCPASWKPGMETIKPSLDLIGRI
jgi:peroxiredoxin (alkyl hydroperoxide reductase subunit C)